MRGESCIHVPLHAFDELCIPFEISPGRGEHASEEMEVLEV
jgi:hypothetical protein